MYGDLGVLFSALIRKRERRAEPDLNQPTKSVQLPLFTYWQQLIRRYKSGAWPGAVSEGRQMEGRFTTNCGAYEKSGKARYGLLNDH